MNPTLFKLDWLLNWLTFSLLLFELLLFKQFDALELDEDEDDDDDDVDNEDGDEVEPNDLELIAELTIFDGTNHLSYSLNNKNQEKNNQI